MNLQKNGQKKNRMKIGLGMMVLILILSACNFGSFFNNDQNELSSTPTSFSNDVSEGNDGSDTFSQEGENVEPENIIETITVFRMDGTEEEIPITYTSSTDLLEAKISSGEWTEGEGLVLIIKYFFGEVAIEEYPEFEYVLEDNGTGILRLAHEYKSQNPDDTVIINELNRLISQMKPSDEVLDLISQSANTTSNVGLAKSAMLNMQASAENCANFQQLGFDPDHFNGEHCYLYEEAMVNGQTYRIYYPSWWQGDDTKKPLLDSSLLALIGSAATFSEFGNFYDINMIFSLSVYPELTNALGIQHPISGSETCPITFFNTIDGMSLENYEQTIAHEAFHCFQDWNTPTGDYDSNKWWLEGSAEYFSNVVYPLANYEHRFLNQFDLRSRNQSLQKMSYENFIFFQHAANTYGNQQVIELLRALGNASGSASALASFQDMSDTFFDFVYKYMSTGINDTGGSMIIKQPIAVTAIIPITDEGEETFSTDAFVASRYGMKYEQEKRFLQSPKPDENIKYSTVKSKERRDPSKWSDLPPELRSTCDEDLLYAMAVTTTETGGSLDFIAEIEKVEEAECDPCLLGVWEVNNSSFEEYIKRLLDSQGGLEEFPPGMELLLEVEGHYYVEFKVDRELFTRRDNFTIVTGAEGFPGFKTIIDSQGNGEYSTTDGERLSLYDVVDYVNQVEGSIDGMPINVTLTPGTGTYSMFGVSGSGPGYENDSDRDSVTSDYLCEEDILIIDDPEFGELLFDRVEEIIPTPVPTMSP
ncbi:MAG TPA: hypothetical protein VK856_15740 [Anaerolineaceae bacterium]|nr:hypothetical protein [Anaerolineaceae bacterium]